MNTTRAWLRLLCIPAGVLAVAAGAADSPLPRWRNNDGMVFIRGGEFVRGGKFPVRVRSFYMDQREVTTAQFCEFLNAGNAKHWNEKQEIGKRDGRFAPQAGKERWPMRLVTWAEASAYAAWAGKRLPTEAEWEWAAAGKERRKFPWGNEPITPQRANFGGHVGHPEPVGSHPDGKTPDGLCDLSGNVAEWCGDWFDPGYYAKAPVDDPPGPAEGVVLPGQKQRRHVRRGGCYAMEPADQESAARGSSVEDYRVGCVGFRCARPARRLLVLLGENFEAIEFAAFTGVMSWATHTKRIADYMMPKGGSEPEVPNIEVAVAGFDAEVRSMAGICVRPDVLVRDLKPEDMDRFDAVAIPACVGSARGRHNEKGQSDLTSDDAVALVRRIHDNDGIVSLMCWGDEILQKAKIVPEKVAGKTEQLVFDPKSRTTTCGGPGIALETACLLLKQLISDAEYRSFRRFNPWLFGAKDEFAPRFDCVR
ncbi:MAG: SUMF1/EgtB/PvdO family nonheme iron enzyme [Verrucomicrobia bacterium]|nr:SUMF1/EgtB/PvdO family nonheme iron enzyme [Verrucomicrobiota bacterium]